MDAPRSRASEVRNEVMSGALRGLLFATIERDVVDERIDPSPGEAEGDGVVCVQVEMRCCLPEAALLHIRKFHRVELPIGRELDRRGPPVETLFVPIRR